MYKIATLNKISPVGLNRLTDKYVLTDDVTEAHGIIVRSQDMKSMELPKNLLAIARAGAGTNNIPIDACSQRGIVVFNTPGANANAVKELVLAGLFIAARNLSNAVAWTKTLTDDVSITVEKNKSMFAGQEIKGKTLGVIGLGAIGVMVANSAHALGMKVIGHDPYMSITSAHQLSSDVEVYESMDAMLPLCDFISIHVPAIENTKQMINKDRFALMKDGVSLLNFSRDIIVDDGDAAEALESGKLGYYITDFPNDKLVENEKVVCIPHLGASTSESEENCAIMAVDQMKDYLENGNIVNSVNYPTCNMGVSTAKARIVVLNTNVSGMLTQITGTFADMGINISDMINRSKGDLACTLVDVDTDVTEDDVKKLLDIEGVTAIRVIPNRKR
ncbi:MAG: 3-phosphoglycerate dehydrogenase family protein [Anaerovoracaceae bacterium]|jgi:D-3-phosphoglycerate dehydrogenase